MARKTTTTTLVRVRRMLLFGLLVFVGTLIALYMFGRPPAQGPNFADVAESPGDQEFVSIGRNFRRQVTEDGKRLFEIEADTLLSNEADLIVLEGVKVIMLRDGGKEYIIEADRAKYNLTLKEGTLTGSVVISGSDGLRLETEGLELLRRGTIVVSTAPIRLFMGGAYEGQAQRFEVHFPRDRIMLAGGVRLSSAPGRYPSSTLRARKTVFFRDTHNFLAEGRVMLRREQDTLRARRLSVNFDETDSNILFANASWEVEGNLGQFDSDGLPATAVITGDELSIVFNELSGDPERLELGGADGGIARLSVTDATGLDREMVADYLWADFADGALRQAEGVGNVSISEGLSFAPAVQLRQLCADSAEAVYLDDGALESMTLAGDVTYSEPDLHAGGDELKSEGDAGTIDMTGDLAWLASSEGKLMAPHIHFDQSVGVAQALGGVRAEIISESAADLDIAEDPELPVQIEARRAEWHRQPPSFEFVEDVRAWQGENFLISQALGVEDEELVATGGVRSVWHKRAPADALESGEPDPPISIASKNMTYSPDEGRLVYQGDAALVQGGRSMRCPLLQLEINDADEFERMYCEGGTQIGDSDAGSRISGMAAIYNSAASKVKVLGEPVNITQGTGGTINARLIVYDFETAIAEIDSVKDEHADLFLTASEYFKQFGPQYGYPANPGTPTLPGAAPTGEPGAVDADGVPIDPAAPVDPTQEGVAEQTGVSTEGQATESPTVDGSTDGETQPAGSDDGDDNGDDSDNGVTGDDE